MIYSTNWIERLNKTIRKTVNVRNSFPNVDSALNLVCAILIDREEYNYAKYPVNSFADLKDTLESMLWDAKKKTHFIVRYPLNPTL